MGVPRNPLGPDPESSIQMKLVALFATPFLLAPASAALVAQFSFEGNYANSVAGSDIAFGANTPPLPTPGVEALGPNAPATGRVASFPGGAGGSGGTVTASFGNGANGAEASIIGDNFTIAAWYRIDSPFTNGGDPRHFLWEGNNDSYDISFNANPTTGNAQSFTQGPPDSNALYAGFATAGIWYHVAQTYQVEGTGIRITTYLNGQAQATTLLSANANANDFAVEGLNIGMHRAESRFFDGQIDELMIWNETLNATQVAAIYAATVPEPSAALLGGLGLLAMLRRRRR